MPARVRFRAARGLGTLAFAIVCAMLGLILAVSVAEAQAAPYLQNVTGDSIVVRWMTATPERGIVRYGEAGTASLLTAEEYQNLTMHEVTLRGLKPGRRYHYTDKAGDQSFTGQFRTVPEPAPVARSEGRPQFGNRRLSWK